MGRRLVIEFTEEEGGHVTAALHRYVSYKRGARRARIRKFGDTADVTGIDRAITAAETADERLARARATFAPPGSRTAGEGR